ncbi:hypothetical protein TNCV_3837371 [Trichonephila clavipes]|nr:hypothetical protein TNCV_3837371 [Trichonephila clavipes]
MSHAYVLEWYKRFSGGRVRVKDYEPAACPRSVITDQNIPKIGKNGKSPNGTSEVLAPELLPAMAAPNIQKCVNADENYFEGDTVMEN